MTIVAEFYDYVVGVDTHSRSHTLACLKTVSGAITATDKFPVTFKGMKRAIAWIARRTRGTTLVVIEGAGCYGAGLARLAAAEGYRVVEAEPIEKHLRRKGKSDPIDAGLIARSVLGTQTHKLSNPRSEDPIRVALAVTTTARDQLNKQQTAAKNELIALLRIIDLGIDARKGVANPELRTIAAWRDRNEDIGAATARRQARHLAGVVLETGKLLKTNETELHRLLLAHPQGPILLAQHGIGPVCAAHFLVAWSHAGRINTPAEFAHLGGTAPIEASSGNTKRHRLDRKGDRKLNRALHAVIRTRTAKHPQTRAYRARRLTEGKTPREIERLLCNYLARQICKLLKNTT